jgi:hypothetical protein
MKLTLSFFVLWLLIASSNMSRIVLSSHASGPKFISALTQSFFVISVSEELASFSNLEADEGAEDYSVGVILRALQCHNMHAC